MAILYDLNNYELKVQRILTYDEIPNKFKSNIRLQRYQQGELWLLDHNEEDAIIFIKPQDVIKHINISEEPNVDKCIKEILYKYNNY